MAPLLARQPTAGLVLVRLALGAIFLPAGWAKLSAGIDPTLVTGASERILAAPAPYAWLGEQLVLRAPLLFAGLIAWGELLGGLAMLVGLCSRPAGFGLAFLALNLYLAGPIEHRPYLLLIGICAFACGLSRAGRLWGLDAWLEPQFPPWMSWVARPKRGFLQ